MPNGSNTPVRRTLGLGRVTAASVLTACLTVSGVSAAQGATDSAVTGVTPSAEYPAPGQPVADEPGDEEDPSTTEEKAESDLRVATLHADLTAEEESGDAVDQLVSALSSGNHTQARAVAQTVQMNEPDVLVVTGVTYDDSEEVAEQLQDRYLGVGLNAQSAVDYPHVFTAPTNSGLESGADLDGDGTIGGPGDAVGHGEYPGQYGMIVFSKYPIAEDEVRTFQNFLWSDLPDNNMPERFSGLEESVLRLAETSMWDIPIEVEGRDDPVHVVASSLAGREDSETETARAEDIRRVLTDYVSGSAWYLSDDDGDEGSLPWGEDFVIAGLPAHGESEDEDLSALLDSARLQDPEPEALTEEPLSERAGSSEDPMPAATRENEDGETRTSFVLPSSDFDVSNSGVFWPGEGEFGYEVVNPESSYGLNDRLVWVDLTDED